MRSNKIALTLAVAGCALFALSSFSAARAEKPGGAEIKCGHLPDDLAVGFDSKAWEKYLAPCPAVKGKESIVYGGAKWHGLQNLGGQCCIGWDSGNLVCLFNVLRDSYHQKYTGNECWKGDHIELQMLFKDNRDAAVKTDVFQVGLSGGNFSNTGDFAFDFPAEIIMWNPPGLVAKGAIVKSQRNKDGYSILVKLPFSLFGFKPEAGKSFYLDVNYSASDNDIGVQDMMSSLSEKAWAGTPDVQRLVKVILESAREGN